MHYRVSDSSQPLAICHLISKLRNRHTIESSLNESPEWQRLDDRRACRIATVRRVTSYADDEALEEILAWMIAIAFRRSSRHSVPV